VLPGAAGVTNTTPTAPTTQSAATSQAAATDTGTNSVAISAASRALPIPSLWIALSVFFAVAWLMTLLLWWRYRRPHPASAATPASTDEISDRAALKQVQQACAQHDPQRVKHALLAWARLHWSATPPLSLGALATQLDDEPLAKELAALDKCLYQTNTSDWQADQLLQAFTRYLKQANKREHAAKPAVLESLHRSQARVAGR
jgi:hypothetical protein